MTSCSEIQRSSAYLSAMRRLGLQAYKNKPSVSRDVKRVVVDLIERRLSAEIPKDSIWQVALSA